MSVFRSASVRRARGISEAYGYLSASVTSASRSFHQIHPRLDQEKTLSPSSPLIRVRVDHHQSQQGRRGGELLVGREGDVLGTIHHRQG